VFELHPTLRIALLESGFTWLPAHLWRFDKEWRNLRRLVPWVKRPPSEYVREHVRVAIQPLDPPVSLDGAERGERETRQLLEVVDQLGSDDLLMYCSDYPHQHAYDPETELLPHLSEALRRKILEENARSFYRL
jgi:predicted TIM-barrel fold metal-dependent hydrolase